jgi:hypothetical protein
LITDPHLWVVPIGILLVEDLHPDESICRGRQTDDRLISRPSVDGEPADDLAGGCQQIERRIGILEKSAQLASRDQDLACVVTAMIGRPPGLKVSCAASAASNP